MPIHEAAAKGFDVAADAYERGRPEYPRVAIEHLVSVLELGPGKVVVDVGAGTGKLTRLLSPSGARLVAVEPVSGMRTKFATLVPDVEVREGSAEALGLPRHSADAIIAAQAFHWFDGERALTEFHDVLKPGGRLALIWNCRDESVDWVARLTELIDRHDSGAPRYRTGAWRESFERTFHFGPLRRAQYHHVHRGTPDTVVDRAVSISFIAALPPALKAQVASDVRELLATHPLTAGQSELDLPYVTDLYWCERTGA